MKALDNRFYVKFMQLEIGPLSLVRPVLPTRMDGDLPHKF